jgi:hypothetical protein
MLSLASMAGNVEGVTGVALETSSTEFTEVSAQEYTIHYKHLVRVPVIHRLPENYISSQNRT